MEGSYIVLISDVLSRLNIGFWETPFQNARDFMIFRPFLLIFLSQVRKRLGFWSTDSITTIHIHSDVMHSLSKLDLETLFFMHPCSKFKNM